MSRTSQRKILNVCLLVLIIGLHRVLFDRNGIFPLPSLVRHGSIWLIIVLFWIPAFTMRKILQSDRMSRRGQYESARDLASEGIKELEAQPWRRRICKLSFDAFSNQPLATAYICLANAQRGLHDLSAAAASYGRAIEIDPLCPTAHLGLAAIASELGDVFQSEFMSKRASELGYQRSISDRIFVTCGKLVAAVVYMLAKR